MPSDVEGGFSVTSVRILQARRTSYKIGGNDGYWGKTICYYLAPGEEAKFPELPQGWRIVQDIHQGEVVPALTLDDDWLQAEIVRVLLTMPDGDGQDVVTDGEVSQAELFSAGQITGGHEPRIFDSLVGQFDIRDPDDCAVEVDRDLIDHTDWEASIYDSQYPWLKPRDVGYVYLGDLPKFSRVIPEIYAKWENGSTGEMHKERLDNNLRASALTTARVALAATEDLTAADKGKEHRYTKRRLGLDDQVSTPFPYEHAYDGNHIFASGPLLAFRTTPDGRYMRKLEDPFMDDHVLIHRGQGYHRFLFIEHTTWRPKVGEHARVAFILPVSVADAECTRTAPLSPQRGMDPRVTQAIQSNPYFASALQHAMHRRKYLRSKINWDGQPGFPNCTKQFPVLLRDVPGGMTLYGARYSRIGKRAKSDGDQRHIKTVADLLRKLPPNELRFSYDSLQPVAVAAPKPRRRVQLDM